MAERETAKPSNQELAALQKWAQQVHDALDGRPLPPCPDEAAARVEALLAERDALQRRVAELENEIPWTKDGAYEAQAGRVAVLEAALRELAYTDVVGDRARCVACKAWWSEYPPTQHEPGCFIGDALAGAVLAGGDAAPHVHKWIDKALLGEPSLKVCACGATLTDTEYRNAGGDAAADETPE